MRIYLAVRHSIAPKQYYGELWSGNFYPALRQLGHEIIESQVDLLPASRFMQNPDHFTPQELEVRAQITQKIITEVKIAYQQKPLNLFLSYFYNAHFDPLGFKEIHRLGIPTVNFYGNNISQFELVTQIAAKVNFSWYPEKNARSHYLKIGANPVWVQMGAAPTVYHPVLRMSRQSKACFVGQRYADRYYFLSYLIHNQIPIELYGTGWGEPIVSSSVPTEKTEYLGRQLLQPASLKSYAFGVGKNLKKQGIIEGIQRTLQQLNYRWANC